MYSDDTARYHLRLDSIHMLQKYTRKEVVDNATARA